VTTAAVVGIGDISANHLGAIADNPAIDLVAVCDIVPERAARAGTTWGVPTFTDHLAMLTEVKPDVVHITLPHFLHVPVAIDALRAGSHVLTEKPLAESVKAARELVEVAHASDRKLGVCFQNRYNPTSQALHEAVTSGRYGEIRGVRADTFWSRTPAYYAASPWRATWAEAGGGTLINQQIHTIDLLCWLLGKPVDVTGMASNLRLRDVIEVEDAAVVSVTHDSGVRSTFFATGAHSDNAPVEIEVSAEQGLLRFTDGVLRHIAPDGTVTQLASDAQAVGARSYWGRSHGLLIDDFYSSLDQPGQFWINADEALMSLEVLRTVYAQSGLIPLDAV